MGKKRKALCEKGEKDRNAFVRVKGAMEEANAAGERGEHDD